MKREELIKQHDEIERKIVFQFHLMHDIPSVINEDEKYKFYLKYNNKIKELLVEFNNIRKSLNYPLLDMKTLKEYLFD